MLTYTPLNIFSASIFNSKDFFFSCDKDIRYLRAKCNLCNRCKCAEASLQWVGAGGQLKSKTLLGNSLDSLTSHMRLVFAMNFSLKPFGGSLRVIKPLINARILKCNKGTIYSESEKLNVSSYYVSAALRRLFAAC